MCINSIQLIVHLPLIGTDLPAHAHYFLIEYLDWLRLDLSWTRELAEEYVTGSPDLTDLRVI